MLFFENLNLCREDVYNIFIPLLIFCLGWIMNLIVNFLKNSLEISKNWKLSCEKSGTQSYRQYVIYIQVIGALWLAIALYLINFVIGNLGIKLGQCVWRISCLAIIFLLDAILYFSVKETPIKFNKDHTPKDFICITRGMNILPIILSFVMSCSILFEKSIILAIIVIGIIIWIIIPYFILDNSSKFQYNYATFYFYNGNIITDIPTDKIFQKGGWVKIENNKTDKQCRFRLKDLEKIEYSNK